MSPPGAPDGNAGRAPAAWNLADWALPPAIMLVLAPVLLSQLGAAGFGVWVLCLAITGLAIVPASALADAATRAVAQRRGTGAGSGTGQVLSICLGAATAYGVLAAGVLLVGAPLAASALPASDLPREAVTTALAWTGALVAARAVEAAIGGALTGLERYDLTARVSLPVNAAVALAWVWLAGHGHGPAALIAASAVAAAIAATGKALLLTRVGGGPLLARPRPGETRAIAVFAWHVSLQGAGGALIHNVDRIVLAAIAGPAPLAAYALCLQLAQNIHIAVARGAAVLFPRASLLAAQGDDLGLRRTYDRGMRLCAVAGATLGVPLVACAHPILTLWAGPAVANSAAGQLTVLAAVYAALATTVMPFYVLNAIGAAGFNALMGWLCGAAVIGCALILVPAAGASGAAWSRFAAIPVGIVCQVAIHRRIFAAARPWHVLAAYVPAVVAIGAALAVAPVIAERVHGPWQLVAVLAASTAGGGILAWTAGQLMLRGERPLPSTGSSPRLEA